MHALLVFLLATLTAIAHQPPVPATTPAPPTTSPATTMKAIRYHEFGLPAVLKLEDVPMPVPAEGEVLIKVHAAAVNPVDFKIRSGRYTSRNAILPFIPGFDVSGVVEAVPPDEKRLKVGDEVYSFVVVNRGGGYAEYVTLPAATVVLKPRSIDHIHAAAVPLAALTAWQAMFDTAKLQPGQTVLIHAGAGGVGHFAIQFAKAKGARVIATASKDNLNFLKELGADEVIDYRTTKFEEAAKDVDVVLDSIGKDTLERSYGVVKRGGFVVSLVARPDAEKLAAHGINGSHMFLEANASQLEEIAALIDAGKVKPHVSRVIKLADASQAHELIESGRTRGKIVLRVR